MHWHDQGVTTDELKFTQSSFRQSITMDYQTPDKAAVSSSINCILIVGDKAKIKPDLAALGHNIVDMSLSALSVWGNEHI